jgi:erythritol kinase (D-erythritol 1-phosphate-forming)
MAWLCIDAGTSVIKSVVFSNEGRELAIARSSVSVLHPQPEFSEQNMEEAWQAVVDTARRAVEAAAVPIHAIATTAQGDGVWLVDADGDPVQHAILWNDGRAASIVNDWQAAGTLEEAAKLSGSMSYPGLPNSIWRWLALHQPESLQRAHASLTCNGWLYLRLTGRIVADLSDASNPFCDVHRRAYSPELLSLYGVSTLAHLLPPIRANDAPLHQLLPSIAEQIGAPAGIPVVMAAYDIVSTAWGSGCIETGQACVILGTTICAEVIAGTFDTESSGTTIALEDAGKFLRAMPTLTGCEALGWIADLLKLESIDALATLAERSSLGADGLLFLPYLSPAGERSPFLNPGARGSWSSLSLRHRDPHLARSVYEGLTYVIRECLAAAGSGSVSEIRVCGGGARSAFWCQMIADVTGCDVIRPDDQELGAKGAFLYGRVKAGEAASLSEAFKSTAATSMRFLPQASHRPQYDAGFARLLKARAHAAQLWLDSGNGEPHV